MGVARHSGGAGPFAVERGELVGESLNAEHVLLGDRLDLPRRHVQRPDRLASR